MGTFSCYNDENGRKHKINFVENFVETSQFRQNIHVHEKWLNRRLK